MKPKLTIIKAIIKSTIAWDIRIPYKTPIYYVWDKKRKPKWNENKPLKPFIIVDYHPKTREWYIGYILGYDWYYYSIIDDITGSINISSSL